MCSSKPFQVIGDATGFGGSKDRPSMAQLEEQARAKVQAEEAARLAKENDDLLANKAASAEAASLSTAAQNKMLKGSALVSDEDNNNKKTLLGG